MYISELENFIKNNNIYIASSIEGKGVHIGRIKDISYDADGAIVINTDIDAKSCTTECYFDDKELI